MNPALAVIAFFLALSFVLGLLARRGRTMSLEQWSVGGRGFGAMFVFLLMAGEIYTTFTFLGGSGWAYGRGAPAFYILGYGAIAYALSYFLLPVVWRYATKHQLHSQADFFVAKYRSPALGVIVSLVGVVALVPYLVLQLKGLGIIVSETSYGSLSVATAVWISVTALVVYVVISGVHGSAWTAVVKDIMILAVAVGLGIYLPLHYYGGYGAMFTAIERAHPGFLTLPSRGMSPSWFVSTVLLSALGFYMWPHSFASAYTSRSEDVFRKNAVVMPLYQLVLLFVFFTGFAAILQVPGLTGAQTDLSLLRIVKLSFPPLMVGLIGAAGLLTALVPGSMILLTACTILAKNVYRPLAPGTSEQTIGRLARGLVPVVALVAVFFTLRGGDAIVPLLLLGYNLVTQLFPALVLSLPEKPLATRAGAMAGILAGEATIAWISLTGSTLAKLFPHWPSAVTDLNIGIVAMIVNVAVLAAVSAVTRRATTDRELSGTGIVARPTSRPPAGPRMARIGLAGLLVLLALVATPVRTAFADGDWNDEAIHWRPFITGLEEAKAQGKPICLVFYADWCTACDHYSKVFHSRPVVEASKHFIMVRVDAGEEEGLSRTLAPDGNYIPRTLFLAPDGVMIPRFHAPHAPSIYNYNYSNGTPAPLLKVMAAARSLARPPAEPAIRGTPSP